MCVSTALNLQCDTQIVINFSRENAIGKEGVYMCDDQFEKTEDKIIVAHQK